MAIAAHPDDIELRAGGTLLKWAAAGCRVTAVVCTGSPQRQSEQRAAAVELGLTNVVFLGYPDGGLEDTNSFRGELVQQIRRYCPDVILTHDPARYREFLHRDHRIAGQVTLDAIYPDARDECFFPEHLSDGLATHKVSCCLLWESDEPKVLIEISDQIQRKIRALECHQSQLAGLLSTHDQVTDIDEMVKESARQATTEKEMVYAEAFRFLRAPC
jgi:LmbE family N-acetylglucosaminyl deacetylase